MTEPAGRLHSLDVFRGATIASMILVNNPGSWEQVYPPLLHAKWHGWTFTDTVFPFFLWIVGVAMTLSFAKRVEQGDDKGNLLLHAVRRGLLIFLIGFGLNLLGGAPLETVRIPGVLQRIGIAYIFAAAIFLYTSVRGQMAAIVGLNVLYAVMMLTHPGGFSPDSNFARDLDTRLLSGHMWSQTKVWDPEGVWSTLPAISTVLLGALAGHLLRRYKTHSDRLRWYLGGGTLLLLAGLIVDLWMPINKNLWTPSFAAFMAGLAMICFGCWYWLVDVKTLKAITRPLAIYGMNALVVFILSGMLARYAAGSGVKQAVMTQLNALFNPVNASLGWAVMNVLVCYLFAWILYRRNWFLRL